MHAAAVKTFMYIVFSAPVTTSATTIKDNKLRWD